MINLYGEQLLLNDTVFDIANGYGKVLQVNYNDFVVHFNNGRRLAFNRDGTLNGVRRIYWHDPLIIPPQKNSIKWGKTKDFIKSCLAYVITESTKV